MCAEHGIRLVYASVDSKKANGHAEASVKHLSHTAKAIMLNRSCPPELYEECAHQATLIRNCMPMRRNIVSKDGCAIRPIEQVTYGRISREQCNRMLGHVVPIGSVCMVFNPRSINSDLKGSKATWLVAMGTVKGSVLFWSPITGNITSSKSYVEVPLPQGYNYEDFFGLENTTGAGAHMKHGKKRVMLPRQEGRRLLVITGLSDRIIPAKPPRLGFVLTESLFGNCGPTY